MGHPGIGPDQNDRVGIVYIFQETGGSGAAEKIVQVAPKAAASNLAEAPDAAGAQAGTCKPPCQIALLQRHPGGSQDGDRLRAVPVAAVQKKPPRFPQCLLPPGRNEPAVLSDQGAADPAGILEQAGSESPLDAQVPPAVPYILRRSRPQEAIRHHMQVQRAGQGAEPAHRGDPGGFPRPLPAMGQFGRQCPRGAGLDAGAACDTRALGQGPSHGGRNRRVEPPSHESEHGKVEDIPAGTNAPAAEDALVGIERHQRMAVIHLVTPDRAGHSPDAHVVFDGIPAKIAREPGLAAALHAPVRLPFHVHLGKALLHLSEIPPTLFGCALRHLMADPLHALEHTFRDRAEVLSAADESGRRFFRFPGPQISVDHLGGQAALSNGLDHHRGSTDHVTSGKRAGECA